MSTEKTQEDLQVNPKSLGSSIQLGDGPPQLVEGTTEYYAAYYPLKSRNDFLKDIRVLCAESVNRGMLEAHEVHELLRGLAETLEREMLDARASGKPIKFIKSE